MVPSPPKIRITSASSEAAGIPMRQSMPASIWKGLRFFAEHPSPKMTEARMCADEGSRNYHRDTEARRGLSSTGTARQDLYPLHSMAHANVDCHGWDCSHKDWIFHELGVEPHRTSFSLVAAVSNRRRKARLEEKFVHSY